MTSAAGDVWLEKSRAPADSTRRYHVVDRRGHLLREVQLRGKGRIIAVGADAALSGNDPRRRSSDTVRPAARGPMTSCFHVFVLRRTSGMKVCSSFSVLALAATMACTTAQSQSAATLDATLPARFGALSNLVELSNGRVLFADTKNKLFFERRSLEKWTT